MVKFACSSASASSVEVAEGLEEEDEELPILAERRRRVPLLSRRLPLLCTRASESPLLPPLAFRLAARTAVAVDCDRALLGRAADESGSDELDERRMPATAGGWGAAATDGDCERICDERAAEVGRRRRCGLEE